MKFKKSFLLAALLTCATLALVSCRSLTVRGPARQKPGLGPPPHAPAHGYRYKQQGVELVYDSGRAVYLVVGFPRHFYCKGRYYRLSGVRWKVGVHIEGPWEAISEQSLPPGLRGKEKDKEKGKGKPKEHPGRGRGLEKN